MQNTIRQRLQEKANEIAKEKIDSFDLAREFGLEGSAEIKIVGIPSRGMSTTVKTTLDDLTDDLRLFLEEALPPMLFDILLKEHLDAAVEVEETRADSIRRARQAQLNMSLPRETLEALYGRVWTTEELKLEWNIVAYVAPLVLVKSRADESLGSFEFQHEPRYYFNYVRDDQ